MSGPGQDETKVITEKKILEPGPVQNNIMAFMYVHMYVST